MFLRILLGISAVLAVCVVWLNWQYQLDDALIYYRYVWNALHGNGLVYNIGERHNALTSPLYTYLLLAVSWLSEGHIQRNAMMLGALSQFALAAGIIIYFRDKLPRIALAAVPFLLFGCYYFFGVYGMETLLYLALAMACFPLFEKQRWGWLGIVAALLILTRSEMVFLVAALALEHRWRKLPFPPLKCYIVPALLFVAHFAFNYFYYGSLLPQSADSKTTQAMSGLWGDGLVFLDIKYMKLQFFAGHKFAMWLFIATGLLGWLELRKYSLFRPWAIFLALYTAFYVGLNVPDYHWYYAPYYLSLVLGQIGCVALLARYARPGAIALLLLVTVTDAGVIQMRTKNHCCTSFTPYQKVGVWLAEHTPPNAQVGALEIGTLGWYSKRPIVDMVGLVSPHNAAWLAKRELTRWVEFYRPDYLVLHDPLWPHEAALSKFREDKSYRKVADFPFPNYQLWQRVGKK